MKNIRIGAVNWDASLTKDTYFGFYQTRSLSQAKYRSWVPFYADIIDEECVDYHLRTPEEYEDELRYAIEAGIDYFAYVWYPTEGSLAHTPLSANDCSHKVYELNYAHKLYEQTTLTDKIGMCAILAAHPFTDNDLEELVKTFEKPYYERLDGRPLLYVYGGYNEKDIKRIHSICQRLNIAIPYTVPMCWDIEDGAVMPLADGFSAYSACNETDVEGFTELCQYAIEKDRLRLKAGKSIIPLFTIGWNPAPRIERPTPWTSQPSGEATYPKVKYAPVMPEEEELLNGVKDFANHIKGSVGNQFAGHILTFSWNEFEEGGFICPTYTPEGSISKAKLNTFRKATEIFRSELGDN